MTVARLFGIKGKTKTFLRRIIVTTWQKVPSFLERMLIGLWAIFSWLPTWIQSLIATGDAQKERGLSMMMLGMGGLTGGFLSGWVVNAIGPRRSMLLCFSVCAALSFLLLKTNSIFSSAIYVEIAVLSLFFGISQGVLSIYIPGLFPGYYSRHCNGFLF
jgi:predicted MFS family arabinose efflux permease